MAAKPTTSLKTWKFNENHVQQNLVGGDFIGSHTVILCATVPRLADLSNDGGAVLINETTNTGEGGEAGSNIAIPIGVVSAVSITQDKQLNQIFELGSKRSYFLSGRTLGSMQLGRVLYKGPTLLRMMYAYYPASKIAKAVGGDNSNILSDLPADPGTSHGEMPIAMSDELKSIVPDIQMNPGFENFFMNLDSDLFSQPHGLILYFKDNANNDVGAVFLEECYIQNLGMQMTADAVALSETTMVRFERVRPIKVRVVKRNQQAGSSGDALRK